MVYLPTFTTNFKPNAGKYISYMDPMGCLIFCLFLEKLSVPLF